LVVPEFQSAFYIRQNSRKLVSALRRSVSNFKKYLTPLLRCLRNTCRPFVPIIQDMPDNVALSGEAPPPDVMKYVLEKSKRGSFRIAIKLVAALDLPMPVTVPATPSLLT
jgi:hypothetical protein